MKLPLLAAALACVSFGAAADEADVRKAVEARLGKVEKIVRAPMAGIWEVTVDGQIFYADDKAGYLILGNLLDMKSGKNLTAERQFNSLPLGILVGLATGFVLSLLVAAISPDEAGRFYYFEIILPGTTLGAIVGLATQKLGPASKQAAH